MYCPNCGTQSTVDQKFCRSCGLNLQIISQVLSGQFSVVQPRSASGPPVQSAQSQRHKFFRRGFMTMWGGILVAASFGITGDAVRNLDQALGNLIQQLAGFGGLICTIGIGLMIYSLFLPKASPPQSFQPTALPHSEPTTPLPPERRPESVPSVTEHTTVKLEAPVYELPRHRKGESQESS